jgi:mono/diheme cytochrome c family protein
MGVVVLGLVLGTSAVAGATTSGEVLYRRYCASCHGTTGVGDGPAAESLSPRPTDLRRLASEVPALMQAIDGRRPIRAHGSAGMPVWGHVLEEALEGRPHRGRTALHEVRVLAEYVRSLQQR